MGDVLLIAISAGVGILTLIFSRLRCRYVTQVNEEGERSSVSAFGFTDRPLVDQPMVEQVVPRPGAVLILKKD
jgi:hypothetical protein